MKRSTTILSSVAGACGLAAGLWSLWPAFDGIFFTQAEASDVAEYQRQVNYEDRIAILNLQLEHETDPEERLKIQAAVDYYVNQIRKMDEARGTL